MVMYFARFIVPPLAVNRSHPCKCNVDAIEKRFENVADCRVTRAFAHVTAELFTLRNAMPNPCDNACTLRSRRRQMRVRRYGKSRKRTRSPLRDGLEVKAQTLAGRPA